MKRALFFLFVLFAGTAYGQKTILSLRDAIDSGLKNNPEIQVGLKRIEEAKAKQIYGISLPQPSISLSYEFTPDGKSLKDFGERTFEINQSLEFPTKYFTRGTKLGKDIDLSQARYESVRFNVSERIKTAFYKVVLKKMELRLSEETLDIAEDFLEKSQIRYNVGEGTNLELLTAKVQKTEAINSVESSKSELRISYNELIYEMGLAGKRDPDFSIEDSLSYGKYDWTPDALIEKALMSNPLLKISGLSLEVSSIEKSLAWQNLLPDLNFSYYRQAIPGDTRFYGISFGISVPLWFMFEHRGKIREAEVNSEIAETEKKNAVTGIITDVKNSLNEFRNSEREVLLYRNEMIPQAEEVYRTAKISYEQGEANYLLFLEAKKTLISAKENYLNSLFRYKLALIKLEQSVGKTLEN